MIPGLGRSLGEEKGNLLHYSGLENPKGVSKSQTQLNDFHFTSRRERQEILRVILEFCLLQPPTLYFTVFLKLSKSDIRETIVVVQLLSHV